MRSLPHMRTLDDRPEFIPSPGISVPYRGYWFYIEDGNLASKRIMGLLNSLVQLEISAGGAQNVPVLTLPISR